MVMTKRYPYAVAIGALSAALMAFGSLPAAAVNDYTINNVSTPNCTTSWVRVISSNSGSSFHEASSNRAAPSCSGVLPTLSVRLTVGSFTSPQIKGYGNAQYYSTSGRTGATSGRHTHGAHVWNT